MTAIFAKMLYLMEKHIDTMLVTIIAHDGSAPRGTGSQMLVEERGRVAGTIGGGTAEKLAEELAVKLLGEKRSYVQDYQLRRGGAGDIGSVCGGDIRVLFQYVASDDGVWKALAGAVTEQIRTRKRGWLIQSLQGEAPALLDENGAALAGEAPEEPRGLMGEGSVLRDEWFSMLLPVGERAVIFGAGHCSLALAPVLRSVGFRVTIFDDRPEFADPALFPDAEQVICGDFDRIADHLELRDEDYVVVMTSGHGHDFQVEEQVLRRPLAYVGVIGSRSKTAFVNQRLRERGVSEEAIASVHTPIGVSIKAVTPAEIAVSIAGEMILVRATYREAAGEVSHACPMH